MKHTIRQNNLGTDDIRRLVPRLALPAMLAQLVNVLYSVVDRMYIGNIPEVGELALAGVGVCGPILTMISAFAYWIGIGGAPLMSIRLGQRDEDGAHQILSDSFRMLLILSAALTLAAYLFQDRLLTAFGATSDIFPYAQSYMRIYLAGTVFAILSLGLNQFIICQGFAGFGMCSVVIGAVCNLILDPVFLFVLGWGAAGAAAATVLSQFASCLFTLWVLLFGHRTPIRITLRPFRADICRRILTVGLSPFLIILFDNILIILQNVMLKTYGGRNSSLLLTCNTIVQSFMLMVTLPLGGITGGTQSILGFNYGAGNHRRIYQAEREIIKTGVIYCTALFAFAQLAPELFVRIFTRDPRYLAQTVRFIRIYTMGIIPLAVQYAIVDGFTGMGIARTALPLSFFRKSLYICLVLFFCVLFGAETIFFAEPISDFAAPVVSGITFLVMMPRILKKGAQTT